MIVNETCTPSTRVSAEAAVENLIRTRRERARARACGWRERRTRFREKSKLVTPVARARIAAGQVVMPVSRIEIVSSFGKRRTAWASSCVATTLRAALRAILAGSVVLDGPSETSKRRTSWFVMARNAEET